MVVELNLADLIKRIDPLVPAYNYCSVLESKASTYEGLLSHHKSAEIDGREVNIIVGYN
jgi:hypothetical protein